MGERVAGMQAQVMRWLGMLALALVMVGCFQSAGTSVQPTSVDINQLNTLATQSQPTIEPVDPQPPTPFITPLPSEGWQPSPLPPTDLPPPTQAPPQATDAPPTTAPVGETPSGPALATLPPSATPIILDLATPTLSTDLLPTPTAIPNTDAPCEHTVQPGEWFFSIARKYNLNPVDLVNANPRTNPDSLQPGDKLIIPNCNRSATAVPTAAPAAAVPAAADPAASAGAAGSNPPSTAAPTAILVKETIYTVVEGDTLGAIAKRYGITVDAIIKANNLPNDLLRVGQRLTIPVAPPQ
jgi:LysM repeat protein